MRPTDAVSPTRYYNPPRIEPVRERVQPETEPIAFRTRAYEQDFAARYTAARLFRPEPIEPTPSPSPSTPSVTTSGSGTETTYRTGSPTRPDISHDNGFLQNPNDPTDPNPIPTVEPSEADREYYEDQLSQATWAQRIDNSPIDIPFVDDPVDKAKDLEDGIEAYRHFLEGNGANRTFSYDEFVSEDASGQTVLNNAIADTQRGAEALYNQMIAADPSLAGQTVTFDMTGGVITVGGSDAYPYPETENWQKAIGGHPIWSSATVTVTPPSESSGEPQFSMDYTLHAEDRYNFNPGQADIATGVPDATRGKLEQTGLAHQYMQYGSAEREVTWTQGDISETTEVENPNEGR